MAYDGRMSAPGFDENMEGIGMCDMLDEGRYGPPEFIDSGRYRSHPVDRIQSRGYDYNHGLNRHQKHDYDQPPYGYGPPIHDASQRAPDSDMYHRPIGRNIHHRPPDHDMYHGQLGPDMHNGPPGPDLYHGHPGPDMHNGPPGPDLYHGHPGPDMHNGEPGPDIYHGHPGPAVHNGPHGHDVYHGPPNTDRFHYGPHGPDIFHGPPDNDVFHGPHGPDIYHRPPGPDICNGPSDRERFHGPRGPDDCRIPHGPDDCHIPHGHGPHGPDDCHIPHGHGPHGPDDCRIPHGHGPRGPDDCHIPHGPDIHHGPPGANIQHGPLMTNIQHVLPGPNIHLGPPAPNIHLGPPAPDILHGPPPASDIHHAPPPAPDVCQGPRGPDVHHELNMHDGHPIPPHPNNQPIHKYPHGHSHHSPLYHGVAPTLPGSALPGPAPPPHFSHISTILTTGAQPIPSVKPTYPPPLPQSPQSEPRPPSLPSPCPPPPCPPSPPPPPPHSPSPRPPSPTSPCPPSPHNADSEIHDEPYDPAEALFSPTSSNGSPQLNERQKESIINKYVKHAQKLKSSSSINHSVRSRRNIKSEKKAQEPKKPVCDKISNLEESPARPNLDTRLKLMFGTSSEKESPRKKEKKKSPPKPPKNESKGDLKEMDRPLSPPPSPFHSKHMYLYWHKVTLKLRKSSKVTSVGFVSAKADSKIQAATTTSQNVNVTRPSGGGGKPNNSQVTIPPKPLGLPLPKSFPDLNLPPVTYKRNLSEELHLKDCNSKAESSMKNVNRMHPYKVNDSKGQVIQSSVDSEFELTCEVGSEEPMCDGDQLKDRKIYSNQDSNYENKTISIVLSKIIDELRTEIRKELTCGIVDEEIKKYIEKHKV